MNCMLKTLKCLVSIQTVKHSVILTIKMSIISIILSKAVVFLIEAGMNVG